MADCWRNPSTRLTMGCMSKRMRFDAHHLTKIPRVCSKCFTLCIHCVGSYFFVCSQFKSQIFVSTLKTRTSKMVNPDLVHGEMYHKQQFIDDDSVSLEHWKLHTYHQDPGMCPLSFLPTLLYNGGTTTRNPPISNSP